MGVPGIRNSKDHQIHPFLLPGQLLCQRKDLVIIHKQPHHAHAEHAGEKDNDRVADRGADQAQPHAAPEAEGIAGGHFDGRPGHQGYDDLRGHDAHHDQVFPWALSIDPQTEAFLVANGIHKRRADQAGQARQQQKNRQHR